MSRTQSYEPPGTQVSLFDPAGFAVEPSGTENTRCSKAAPTAYCRPSPGKRFFRIGLENGKTLIVEVTLSMMDLSAELRNRKKVPFKLTDGRTVEVASQDVRYLENVYQVQCHDKGN